MTSSSRTSSRRRNSEAAAPFAAPGFEPPPPPDLSAPVVYFPVRHHSPACAHHVRRLIYDWHPQVVLIEGPRDATPLIPLLLSEGTTCPIAVYTTYVERAAEGLPRRHAAYYPLCDYSPEWVAMHAAAEVGANCKFIDLTYPEMVRAGRTSDDDKAQSLFEERALRHGRFLRQACARAGVRDSDELWDHFYEDNHEAIPVERFMHNLSIYCALARHDQAIESLRADGTLAREQAMAAAIAAEEAERVLVVAGGFHTVALQAAEPAMPPEVEVAEQDALVVLMRYGFEQLDRLNGYASGMPAPGFYQRLWDGDDVGRILVELGRRCRKRRLEITVADEIAALDHCQRLAALRGHAGPAREDLLDAIRACFIKGAANIEGVQVLALARQLLAGDAVGQVPADAGQPPIVVDFRAAAGRFGLELDRIDAREVVLDLYRKPRHRQLSRFFYRLQFLGVPFADFVRGPDFVLGANLERIQEVWKYHWSPAVEGVLIERSVYGSSVEEAAAAMLLEAFAAAESAGEGRRADVATSLLLSGCRMGLHRHARDLLERTSGLIAEDMDFVSLVHATETLLALHVSREPLEAHSLGEVVELAEQAYVRAVYVLPQLAATPEEQTEAVLDALNVLAQAAATLGDDDARRELRHQAMRELASSVGGNAALRGAAVGVLYADGQVSADDLIQQLRGHLLSAKRDEGPAFLQGLMRTARNVLWQACEAIDAIHEVLRDWPEDEFIRQAPRLRLAFADLTPRECNELSGCVAERIGVQPDRLVASAEYSAADVLLARDMDQRVRQALQRDHLEEFLATGEQV